MEVSTTMLLGYKVLLPPKYEVRRRTQRVGGIRLRDEFLVEDINTPGGVAIVCKHEQVAHTMVRALAQHRI